MMQSSRYAICREIPYFRGFYTGYPYYWGFCNNLFCKIRPLNSAYNFPAGKFNVFVPSKLHGFPIFYCFLLIMINDSA